MKKFFKGDWPALVIFLILFVIPSFWFDKGKVDYGGDSNRLYFYDPFSWLNNIALYLPNPLTSLGGDTANFMMIPLLLFLGLLKKLFFHTGYSLNNFFNGLILSGGFLSVYFIVKEFLKDEEGEEREKIFPAIIAGLFFVLSPILSMQWERSLYSISGIFVYPLIFLLFLKFIHTSRFYFLTLIAIVCFVFSVNFSFATMPWFFAFFPLSFIFLVLYSAIKKKTKILLRGSLVLFFLLLLILSFDIFVQIYNLANPFGMSSKLLAGSDRALPYFLSIQAHVRLIYNLLNQDQFVITSGFSSPFEKVMFSFGIKYLPVFVFYPLIVGLGVILVQEKKSPVTQKILGLLLVFFLIFLYLMTSNVTGLGVTLYKALFKLPLFGMFRSFYSKFGMTYVFFYALLLAYSLFIVWGSIKSLVAKTALKLILIFLVCFNGWPLISGRMSDGTLWRSRDISFANEIDPQYQEFIERLKEEKQNFKVLSFPLANEDYQVLQGKTGGVYFGPSSIPILTGKNTFSGQQGFTFFWLQIQTFIDQKKFEEASKLLSLLNIGYVFHNSDDYIYQNFPNYPYSDWFKQTYTNQKQVEELVRSLPLEKVYSIKTYNLYRLKNEYLLPHFYIPEKIILSDDGVEVMPAAISMGNLKPRTAFFLGEVAKKEVPGDNFRENGLADFYVDAKNRDLDFLEKKQRIKDAGVPYSSITKKNIWQRWWALLREKVGELGRKDSGILLIREELTSLNDKLNEAISFNESEDGYLRQYKKGMSKMIEAMRGEGDFRKQAEVAFSLKYSLEDNLTRLEQKRPKNFSDWIEAVQEFKHEVEKYTPKFAIEERNYQIEVPKTAEYALYMDEPAFSLASRLVESMKGCSLRISDGVGWQRVVVDEPVLDQKGWVSFGNFRLAKGQGEVKVIFCNLENQIKNDQWETYVSDEMAEEAGEGEGLKPLVNLVNIDGFILPPSKKIFYQNIAGWEPELWYEISGKLKGKGKIKVAIGEERKRWVVSHSKAKLLKKLDVVKTEGIEAKPEGVDFKFELKSSPMASAAKIFFYYEDNETKSEQDAVFEIEKVNVLPVLNPRVVLKSVEKPPPIEVSQLPRLTFSKVNPAKYRVKVEGAYEPYFLVFSDSFHPGWSIFLDDGEEQNKNIFGFLENKVLKNFLGEGNYGETIANYFDGQIKEASHRMTFLESSVFETWGRRALAKNNHFLVNGYANSWYITPEDTLGKQDYELILEFVPQRTLYLSLFISGITLSGCLLFTIFSMMRKIVGYGKDK